MNHLKRAFPNGKTAWAALATASALLASVHASTASTSSAVSAAISFDSRVSTSATANPPLESFSTEKVGLIFYIR